MNRKEVAWYAVRCCCTPRKVFGFLKLDSNLADHEYKYVTDNQGYEHRVLIRVAYIRPENKPRIECGFVVQGAGLPIDLIPEELAVYSDDRPIEFWRTIKGFVEAPDGQDQPR